VDAAHGLAVEQASTRQARHLQAVLDVLRGFGGRQRVQVVARNHPLRQLLHVGALQHVAQLRLADQHDLQQLALIGFQIRQQPQLLQHLRGQVLGLIDDEDVLMSLGMAVQQVGIEPVHVLLDPGRGARAQVRQRLAVALAHVEVARVRRDREGLVLEPEVLGVHGAGG
jgi:hypothetical protein